MLKQPTNKQKTTNQYQQQNKKTRKTNGRFVEQSSSSPSPGIGETSRGRSSTSTATKTTTTMCNFYHVFSGRKTEGFSFFWFSFRSVTTFLMLRGLLRLGVLPGLRGGAVPGRGEGKVYEVARNVGEVSGRPSTGTSTTKNNATFSLRHREI